MPANKQENKRICEIVQLFELLYLYIMPAHGMRLFVGAALPLAVIDLLQREMIEFQQFIARGVSVENWHVTVAFLGEVPMTQDYLEHLLQPLPQAFAPVVRFTHAGRGLMTGQLWAFAQPTNLLADLRQQVLARTQTVAEKEFRPHVRLANLKQDMKGVVVADRMVNVSFTLKELGIFRSHTDKEEAKYELLGTIRL
jgi:2'-5' RNA ligase